MIVTYFPNFTAIFSGETGIGKSTLMDTLFNTHFDSTPSTHDLPGVKLKANTYELQESNVRLKLRVVDSVGFGDQINKEDRYDWSFWIYKSFLFHQDVLYTKYLYTYPWHQWSTQIWKLILTGFLLCLISKWHTCTLPGNKEMKRKKPMNALIISISHKEMSLKVSHDKSVFEINEDWCLHDHI